LFILLKTFNRTIVPEIVEAVLGTIHKYPPLYAITDEQMFLEISVLVTEIDTSVFSGLLLAELILYIFPVLDPDEVKM
jgi:hypothetical protein